MLACLVPVWSGTESVELRRVRADLRMQFADLPADIFLYLLDYLGLDDALHLLSTCTSIRRLSENRSLWIQILRQTESDGSQPLACPLQTDLSQLTLSDLQKIARHTVRLQKNWSSENPRIIGEVTALQCEEINGPFSILVVIPGTSILVLHYSVQLWCYDLEIKDSWRGAFIGELHDYAQFRQHGRHFIAVVHEKDEMHFLDVFRMDHGPGVPRTMHPVYHNMLPPLILVLAVCMQDAMVGIIYSKPLIEELYLIIFDISTNASITIPLPQLGTTFPTYPEISCLVQGNSVYISAQQLETCTCSLYVCDISDPWDTGNTDGRFDPSLFATFAPVEPVPDTYAIFPITCQTLHPVGLTAMHAIIPSTDAVPITINILFQPDIFTSFLPSNHWRLVLFGEAREKNPSVFVTYSGRYLLVCVSSASGDESLKEADPQLYVLHFVKGPPASVQVRRLPIPFFVQSELEADKVHSIALDDHLGVLYLTSERGFIFAVPFA